MQAEVHRLEEEAQLSEQQVCQILHRFCVFFRDCLLMFARLLHRRRRGYGSSELCSAATARDRQVEIY